MCLVLDKQARLENVEFQFWTVRLPLQLFTGAGEGMLSLVPPWAPAWTETIDTQQAMQSLQGQAQHLWQRIDKGRGLPLISGLCHSQLILLAEHQFKSETHHGCICSSGCVGPFHGLTCTGQSLCSWETSQEAPASALAAVGL